MLAVVWIDIHPIMLKNKLMGMLLRMDLQKLKSIITTVQIVNILVIGMQ